jgi:hypothetical protein
VPEFTLDQLHTMMADRRQRLEDIAGMIDITENGVTYNVESRRKSLMDEIDWLRKQIQAIGGGDGTDWYGRAV